MIERLGRLGICLVYSANKNSTLNLIMLFIMMQIQWFQKPLRKFQKKYSNFLLIGVLAAHYNQDMDYLLNFF